jgi:four helix bundle protein
MKDKITSFSDLTVWQKAHELEIYIYKLTGKFPRSEIFGLISQLRRAGTSISANIAEGMGRGSYADRMRFYYNSRGSMCEVESLLITAKDLKYLSDAEYNNAQQLVEETGRLLNGFIAKTRQLISNL